MSLSYEDILCRPTFHREAVQKVARYIRKHHQDIKVIACRGSSGAAVAYPVAYKLGLEVCHVRKDGERPEGRKYVIVDDFISMGHTLRDILGVCGAKTCQEIVLYMACYGHGEYQSHGRKFTFTDERQVYNIPIYQMSRYDYKCATEPYSD